MKCMIRIERIRSYQMKKWSWGQKKLGKEVWSDWEKFGEVRRHKLLREIREKWRKKKADPIYRNPSFSMDREVSRIIFFKISCWGANKRCPKQKRLDGSRSYRASIEHTETSSMDQVAIEKLSRLNLNNLDGLNLR